MFRRFARYGVPIQCRLTDLARQVAADVRFAVTFKVGSRRPLTDAERDLLAAARCRASAGARQGWPSAGEGRGKAAGTTAGSAALGVPYAYLSNDMLKANYSNSRLALLEFRRRIEAYQNAVTVWQLCRQVCGRA